MRLPGGQRKARCGANDDARLPFRSFTCAGLATGADAARIVEGVRDLATIAGTKSAGNPIDEFIDTFYLDHPDKARQQRRLNEPPAIVGDPFIDAWIGAVGGTWQDDGTSMCPPGLRRPDHDRLSRPAFVPDSKALRGTLLAESPPAFRSRMIFTFVAPLQRARFPRDVTRICRPA